MKTIIDFFVNSRISWDELGEIPMDATAIFVSDSASKYYTINDKKETFIIRVSDHWGMVYDCYWLIAGETQKSGEQRIGCARLNDFEDKKSNSWSSLKELYELLPEEPFEIVEVWKNSFMNIINGFGYDAKKAMGPHGRCNAKVGWTFYSIAMGSYINLPANILIKGDDEYNLTINNIGLSPSSNRESIVFVVGMSMLSSHLQESPDNVYYSSYFPELFKQSGIPFIQEGDDFIFKIKKETLRVTMKEACDEQASFTFFIKKIAFC